jgi:ribosome-associated translation inhibitor RaiA
MKTVLTYTSPDGQTPWPALLQPHLDNWHSLTAITAAGVILEQQHKDPQPFRVKAWLETAGVRLQVETRDSTLDGAVLLAAREMERQIEALKNKRAAREEKALQRSGSSRPRTGREA